MNHFNLIRLYVQYFVQGITQVLFSLTVIELSKPGLEATVSLHISINYYLVSIP